MAVKNSNFLYLFATTASDYLGFGTSICSKQLKKVKFYGAQSGQLYQSVAEELCMDIDIVWKKEDLFSTILVR